MTAPASGSPDDSPAQRHPRVVMARGVGLPLRCRPPEASEGAVSGLRAGFRDRAT
jgi:hypothetical protein